MNVNSTRCGGISLLSLENSAAVKTPEKSPQVDEWCAFDRIGDEDLLARVTLEFPGYVVQTALKSEQCFDQPQDRQKLTLSSSQRPCHVRDGSPEGADLAAVMQGLILPGQCEGKPKAARMLPR